MNWYMISYATAKQFLGATVVEGHSETNALSIAHNNGLNPGGQSLCTQIPEECVSLPEVVALKYKLLYAEDVAKLGKFNRFGDLSEKEKELIRNSSRVSERF